MGLNRLDNFLKSVRGAVIYVNPDSLDASDAIDNQGNSAARPFITIQRALIEAARFSYQSGFDNDRFDKTTILVYPGEHIVDNRPGWIPDWEDGNAPSYLLRNGTQSIEFKELDFTSNFNVEDPDNDLYKFNSIHGGVIIPRGASIVGMDLRKTKIRPKYVPNPENDSIERSAIFRVTGGSYLWKFSIFDANPNGQVYKDYTSNTHLPNFSHHKLTAFEYADGTNPVEISDDFISSYSTTRTDLDIYYNKIGIAYGTSSGRQILNDYPSTSVDIQSKVDEYRIVGSRGFESVITDIQSGNGTTSSSINTVTFETPIPGIEVDTPIQIQGVSVEGYNGQFVVSEVVGLTTVKYKTNDIPTIASPTEEQTVGATINLISDTVTSASPYIFNVSLRSVYGMCGLHADGSKSDGFKSIVVAQFTGIGLQKDDNAFVKYNPALGLYQDNNSLTNLYSDSKSLFKPQYQNYHIKASNDAFIQIVSVFAIGYAEHFKCESGGDLSITNSNSNFGAKSLVSEGYRSKSFERDDIGYITHVISPQEIDTSEINVEFESIDISKTLSINISDRLYIYNQTNQDVAPESVLDGYRVGAKKNDQLNVLVSVSNQFVERSAKIIMHGSSQISYEKSYKVAKKINNIDNEITNNTITLTENHEFENGETVRVISNTGQLPDGLKPQIYYVITSDINGTLQANQIRLAATLNDALNGDEAASAISIYSNELSDLKVISRVSDKKSGDIGHPIQWDNNNKNWYILVESGNSIFSTLSSLTNQLVVRSYIKRVSEFRNIAESVYKFRYVIPKDSPLTARPPLDGYVIQESGTVTGETGEISKYYSLTTKQLSNSTELRNFKFIAGATWVNGVATFTSELPHKLMVGDKVQINNVQSTNNSTAQFDSGFNGEFIVTGVTDRKTFTLNITSSPGTFTNNTAQRDENLPNFKKLEYKNTFVIYRVQEIEPYIKNEQDGVYHLLVTNSSYSPLVEPFNNSRFSQPIQNLYPQLNRDNPESDPKAASSFALSYPVGQVITNDPELSLTKETLNKINEDFNVGVGITNIVSNSVGTSHTIFTSIDHGLNRVTKVSILNSGSGYGLFSGVAGTLYNAKLVTSSGTTGDGATAVVSHNSSGEITSVKIMDGGSAYEIGDQLQITGVATTTGFSVATVSVTAIYNNANDVISVNGIKSDNLNDYDRYNGLYRITGVTNGQTKQFTVSSASTITNPVTASTGIGFTYCINSRLVPTGSSIGISSIFYSNVSGIGTITTSSIHGLKTGNKIRIGRSNNNFFNRDFIVRKVVNTQIIEVDCGISTSTQTHSGTAFIHRNSYTSAAGKINKSNENVSGRLNVEYCGITTFLQTTINDPNLEQINIQGIQNLDFELGDYLLINDEIMRIKQTVTGNPVTVYRGVLGTRKSEHLAESVIRRINPRPIEFRRNSIIRASGHTFEYVGFGPGNYSTALPDKQDRQLSAQEELLAQSTKINGGIVVFTGMNDAGDFYIGNKKVSSATGQEEVFDTPIPTVTGEELDLNIGGLSVGFDVLTPLEVSINRSISVGGGNDNNIISKFDGPVIFTNKITSKSDKGIEVSSLFIQGDAATSRKYSVGISTPSVVGNTGDLTYNANPREDGFVGWVYTFENNWRRFGPIQNANGRYVGIWSGTFIGDGSGLTNVSDIWVANNIGIATDRLIGVNTNTAKSGISLFVNGSSEFNGIVTFTNTAQSTSPSNGVVIVKGGVGIGSDLNVGGNINIDTNLKVTGISSFIGTSYFNNISSRVGVNTVTFQSDVTFDQDITIDNNLYVNDDFYLRNQPIRSVISGYSIVFGL